MTTLNNKKLLYVYAGLAIWGLIAFILIKYLPTTPLALFLLFFWLLMTPGFTIARILKLSLHTVFEYVMLWLILGLTFGLTICLIAILIHLNITSLLWLYLLFICAIYFVSLFLEYFRPTDLNIKTNIKNLLGADNLILIFLALFAIITVSIISQIGGNFDGDPSYHLAIMRKAIEGLPFSIENLSFVKNQPMPAYAIMIWPVFLSLIAKIANLSIYNLWGEIPTALTFIVLMAWYGLFRKIFPIRYMAILAVFIFMIFMFEGTGYLFTRLPVPDTFAKLVLVPLALWLTLKYSFAEKSNYKILGILIVFLPLLALVHLTQYFYFYLIMTIFIILFTVFRFKDPDYSKVLKRIITATFSNLILAIPLFGSLQLKTGIITNSYNTLSSRVADSAAKVDTFTKFDIFTKFAYVFYPLTLLFLKKYRVMIIIFASMIIAPIVFHTPVIYNFCNSLFSFVFMKRLFSNVTWYFAVWALFVGFIIILIDRFLSNQKPLYRSLISVISVIISFVIWLCRDGIYTLLFSSKMGIWLNQNFLWIIIVLSILAIVLFFLQGKNAKFHNIFNLTEPKNSIVVFFISISFIGLLCFSAEKTIAVNLSTQIRSNTWISPIREYSDGAVSIKKIGGQDTLDYIKTNIPSRSIFESDIAYRDLPVEVDVYMSGWPNKSLPEKEYSKIYEKEGDLSSKLICLQKAKANYMLISAKKNANIQVLNDYLTEIYKNDTVNVYKVDQVAINALLGSNINLEIDCRAELYKK